MVVVSVYAEKKLGDAGLADSNVLVVGSKGSGKSTLISRFLNPDKQEPVKETMGLDYVFGRKTAGQDKTVAHIWELGGGEDQANLMDAVITPEHLRCFVAVIVVDLSKPATVLDSLAFWMDRLRQRIDNCLRVMKEKKSTMPGASHGYWPHCSGLSLQSRARHSADRLKAKAIENFGADHADLDVVKLSPVPILVAAAKFDTFVNADAYDTYQHGHATERTA